MREHSAHVLRAVTKVVGADEAMLMGGLMLVTVGLWSFVGAGALVAPGAVITWIAVPSRARFILPVEPDSAAITALRKAS